VGNRIFGRGESIRIAPAADVKLGDSPMHQVRPVLRSHCLFGAIYETTRPASSGTPHEGGSRCQDPCAVRLRRQSRVAPPPESFGLPPGDRLTGKIYTALRRLGFDAVFDTNFSADLTIMEEGTEFVHRLTGALKAGMRQATADRSLPLITSCCPAWVDYMEKYYSDMIPNFSTQESPADDGSHDQDLLGCKSKSRSCKDLFSVHHAMHREEI
jgi:NADH-quinone oxidoreductase subunit G